MGKVFIVGVGKVFLPISILISLLAIAGGHLIDDAKSDINNNFWFLSLSGSAFLMAILAATK